MVNELRYYMGIIQTEMAKEKEPFVPQYIVTAVKLPTGAIEVAVNTSKIAEKIEYILDAYDEDMKLKTNPEVVMQNLMIV